MKKLLWFIILFVSCLIPRAASVTLVYDPIVDTNITKVLLYIRTNGLINTNYSLITSNQLNLPTTISNLASGTDLSFYATTVDKNFLESDPSNVASYFTAIGIPPINFPVLSITSYDKSINSWRGITVLWAMPTSNYNITNFVVTFEGNGQTNRYNTLTNQFSLNTLALSDYKIYVQGYNKEGVSPISIYSLMGKNPRRVLGFSAQ